MCFDIFISELKMVKGRTPGATPSQYYWRLQVFFDNLQIGEQPEDVKHRSKSCIQQPIAKMNTRSFSHRNTCRPAPGLLELEENRNSRLNGNCFMVKKVNTNPTKDNNKLERKSNTNEMSESREQLENLKIALNKHNTTEQATTKSKPLLPGNTVVKPACFDAEGEISNVLSRTGKSLLSEQWTDNEPSIKQTNIQFTEALLPRPRRLLPLRDRLGHKELPEEDHSIKTSSKVTSRRIIYPNKDREVLSNRSNKSLNENHVLYDSTRNVGLNKSPFKTVYSKNRHTELPESPYKLPRIWRIAKQFTRIMASASSKTERVANALWYRNHIFNSLFNSTIANCSKALYHADRNVTIKAPVSEMIFDILAWIWTYYSVFITHPDVINNYRFVTKREILCVF